MNYKLISGDKEYKGTPISIIKEISHLEEIEGSLYYDDELLITGNKYALLNELKLEEFINLTNSMKNRVNTLNKKSNKNKKDIKYYTNINRGILIVLIGLLGANFFLNIGLQLSAILLILGGGISMYIPSNVYIKNCEEENKSIEKNINRLESNMADVEIKINELEEKKFSYIEQEEEKQEELEKFLQLAEKVKVKKMVLQNGQ